uniref:Ribosomal RNA methyltransferase FtsJ domain-containing protein n=1 Tax=Panagrolaimus superbus TaxID=310955 RepID=A0A914Z164_9BILA
MGLAQRERRDIWYKVAKAMGYRSRSALKLLQIHQKLKILDGIVSAVDLCASPGGFSQVLAEYVKSSNHSSDASYIPVLGIDIQPIHDLEGVEFWVQDITDQNLYSDIIKHFMNDKVDLVLCDGAPDGFGTAFEDGYYQEDLVLTALQLAIFILRPDATFVVKVFRGKNSRLLTYRISHFFESIVYAKPRVCRQSSCEAFLVCRKFNLPSSLSSQNVEELREAFWRFIYSITDIPSEFNVDYIVCGEAKYDADANYPELPEDFEYSTEVKPPLMLPTNPAYKIACELKKQGKLCKTGKN